MWKCETKSVSCVITRDGSCRKKHTNVQHQFFMYSISIFYVLFLAVIKENWEMLQHSDLNSH